MSTDEKPAPVTDAQLVAKEVKEWVRHLSEITGIMGFAFSFKVLEVSV